MNDKQPAPRPRRRSTKAVVRQICELVKSAYKLELKIWNSGGGKGTIKPDSDYWDIAWTKMAEFLLDKQIGDYRSFLRTQFLARGKRARPPTPQQCYGPRAWHIWKKSQSESALKEELREISLAYEFQKEKYKISLHLSRGAAEFSSDDWSESDHCKCVLYDKENGLTALFRYCVAAEEELKEVRELYRNMALLQYSFARRTYDRVWKDWIPAELRKTADQLVLDVVAGFKEAEG